MCLDMLNCRLIPSRTFPNVVNSLLTPKVLHIHAHNRLLRRTSEGGVKSADSSAQTSEAPDTVAFDLLRNKFNAGEVENFMTCTHATKSMACENTFFVKLENQQAADLILAFTGNRKLAGAVV